jgi:D-alanyl-D-alanine carboxypeptidase/D-alanyl-D-alanine-endopeptidase (penicillin-binding protein 4)
MRGWRVAVLAALVAFGPSLGRAENGAEGIAAVKDAAVALSALAPSSSITAVELGRDRELVSVSRDSALNAASNAKLFTTAAALHTFGADHTFRTEFWGIRGPAGLVLSDLVLVAGGDPQLSSRSLAKLAKGLRRAGVTGIQGNLVIDDSLFGGSVLPSAFDKRDEPDGFRATISAFCVDSCATTVSFRPGKALGEPAVVSMSPDGGWLLLRNESRTVDGKDERLKVLVEREGERTRVVVTGEIGLTNRGGSVERRVDDPALLAGHALLQALKAGGIALPNAQVVRGKISEKYTMLHAHTGQPLARIVEKVNQDSDNAKAEMLFLALAAKDGEPSFVRAAAAVAAFAKKAGVSGELRFLNGSGLYDADYFSAAQCLQLLRWGRGGGAGPEAFFASLPVAAKSGTLARRLTDTPLAGVLRAKTGTLDNASALSGYLTTRSGKEVAFSLLLNGESLPAKEIRKAQDQFLLALHDL